MIIYPAIDVKNGYCVRLKQGDYNEVTVYSKRPVDVALDFEKLGARWMHVVDLDGARAGKPMNIPVISEMAVNLAIPVQMGGGIRDIETIEIVLNKGVHRIILGTTAVSNQKLVEEALKIFQDSIAIGIDALDGYAKVEGWEKSSGLKAVELAKKMEQFGASTIIYTDISKDGMLQGPNFDEISEMVNAVKCNIIASGGVSSLNDLIELKKTGVSGAIVGKALYTGDIDFKKALKAVEGD